MNHILVFFAKHKMLFLLLLCVLIGGGIYYYQTKATLESTETSYEFVTVEKGSLMVTLDGLGQVENADAVDLKSKVSGDVKSINVKRGDIIKKGDIIALIDNGESLRNITKAQADLEIAKMELLDLVESTDEYSLMQAENAVIEAKENLDKLKITQNEAYEQNLEDQSDIESEIAEAYDDTYTDISDAYLELPDIKTGLYNTLYSNDIDENERQVSSASDNINLLHETMDIHDAYDLEIYMNSAEYDYLNMESAYNEAITFYKELDRESDIEKIMESLEQTLALVKLMEKSIKSNMNLFDYWVDYRERKNWSVYQTVSDYQDDLDSYLSITNKHLSSLSSIYNNIDDKYGALEDLKKEREEMERDNPLDIVVAERSLQEKEYKLTELQAGPDTIDIMKKELTIQEKENNLLEEQQSLEDFYIKAPFNGVVTGVELSLGDAVSSSSSVISMISEDKIVKITLNEVDVAKVKLGQKVLLTFDAIEDLTLTGEIFYVDVEGEVSQGVVSFGVEISLDMQDERIKSGMTVSATIIVDSKINTLIVANSVIEENNGVSQVKVLENAEVVYKVVSIGLSNDVEAEILSGLSEGDQIISKINTFDNSEDISSSASTGNDSFGQGMGGSQDLLRMMR